MSAKGGFTLRNDAFIAAAMSKDIKFGNNTIGDGDESLGFSLSIVGVKNLTDKTLSPFR